MNVGAHVLSVRSRHQGKPTTVDGNIQVMYRFRCDGATSNRIDQLGIRLSDQLLWLEKLKPQTATEKGEIAQELSPANGNDAIAGASMKRPGPAEGAASAPSQQRISRVKGYHLLCPSRISAGSIQEQPCL